MTSCPNCGATNPETATFCNLCMTPFGALPGVASQAPPPAAPPGFAGAQQPYQAPPIPPSSPGMGGGYSPAPPGAYAPPGPPGAYPPPGPPGAYPPPGPPGAYPAGWSPAAPPKKDKLEGWKVALLVGIPVLLIVIALGAIVFKPPAGGTLEMSKLNVQFKYPDGWANETNNESKKREIGFSDSEVKKLPDGNIDALLMAGKQKALLIFSAVPSSTFKFDGLADDLGSTPGMKVIDPVSKIEIMGDRAYKMVAETTANSGFFGLPQTFTFEVIIFQRNGRLAFFIGGAEKDKFEATRAELDQMITTMEPVSV